MYRKLAAVAVLGLLAAPVLAGTPGLDARQQLQRERIAQGVRSGELTRFETRQLVADQLRLARHERLAKADGVVTRGERARLQRHADRTSQRIYRQKHDRQSR